MASRQPSDAKCRAIARPTRGAPLPVTNATGAWHWKVVCSRGIDNSLPSRFRGNDLVNLTSVGRIGRIGLQACQISDQISQLAGGHVLDQFLRHG